MSASSYPVYFEGHCWYLAGWGDEADSPVAMFQQVGGGECAALLVVEEGVNRQTFRHGTVVSCNFG